MLVYLYPMLSGWIAKGPPDCTQRRSGEPLPECDKDEFCRQHSFDAVLERNVLGEIFQ